MLNRDNGHKSSEDSEAPPREMNKDDEMYEKALDDIAGSKAMRDLAEILPSVLSADGIRDATQLCRIVFFNSLVNFF